VIGQQLYGPTLEYTVVPFAGRYKKSVDNQIKERELTPPGAPAIIRSPAECRARWGDPFRQTHLVDGVEDGSKVELVYDRTERITEVDPDIKALVRGSGREVPGETVKRQIPWIGPGGDKRLIKNIPIPVRAGPQDLLYYFATGTKRQELHARFVKITPDPNSYRVMADSLEGEAKEYKVRIPGNDTPASIRIGLQILHPGKSIGAMTFEGGEVDDGEDMSDWVSRTGTSDFRVKWNRADMLQRFTLWTEQGLFNLGEEDISKHTEEQIWQALKTATQFWARETITNCSNVQQKLGGQICRFMRLNH
jgi:hypothetical protein